MRFPVYYLEREYAQFMGDPRLGFVEAASQEEAERKLCNGRWKPTRHVAPAGLMLGKPEVADEA